MTGLSANFFAKLQHKPCLFPLNPLESGTGNFCEFSGISNAISRSAARTHSTATAGLSNSVRAGGGGFGPRRFLARTACMDARDLRSSRDDCRNMKIKRIIFANHAKILTSPNSDEVLVGTSLMSLSRQARVYPNDEKIEKPATFYARVFRKARQPPNSVMSRASCKPQGSQTNPLTHLPSPSSIFPIARGAGTSTVN